MLDRNRLFKACGINVPDRYRVRVPSCVADGVVAYEVGYLLYTLHYYSAGIKCKLIKDTLDFFEEHVYPERHETQVLQTLASSCPAAEPAIALYLAHSLRDDVREISHVSETFKVSPPKDIDDIGRAIGDILKSDDWDWRASSSFTAMDEPLLRRGLLQDLTDKRVDALRRSMAAARIQKAWKAKRGGL